MADEAKKLRLAKPRGQNYSLNDCLVLVEFLGKPSYFDPGLTNYKLLKHKFTPTITSGVKKEVWRKMLPQYNAVAEVPRQGDDLTKKWDNLVQVHKSKYADYNRQQLGTGGGPRKYSLSPLTEAVMNVIGRTNSSVVGVCPVNAGLDTTWLQIPGNTNSTSCQNDVLDLEVHVEEHENTTATNTGGYEVPFTMAPNTDMVTSLSSTVSSMPFMTLSSTVSSIPVTTLTSTLSSIPVTTLSSTAPSIPISMCLKCHCTECYEMRQLKKQKIGMEMKFIAQQMAEKKQLSEQ